MFKRIFDNIQKAVNTVSRFVQGQPTTPLAKPKKAQRPEFHQGNRIVGKLDPRAPLNFAVVMERQSADSRTNWLVGYNNRHHPDGIEDWKGLTHYRVRTNA